MSKKRMHYYSILVVLLLPFCHGHAASFQPTPTLANVPDNTWIRVNQGGVTAPAGILSYSGGWYDPVHHQFCLFGGGHWDYSGNEVWCFDIAKLAWKEMYKPDVVTRQGQDQRAYNNYDNSRYPGALFKPAGEPVANANPMSKHTYDQMEYVDGLGPVIWGGYSWGDGSTTGWCVNCKDTWAFNFKTSKWRYIYNGSNPSPNIKAGVGASAYASKENLLYALVPGQTWAFNPRNNSWTQVRTNGNEPWSIEMTLEYDSKRNVLYSLGGTWPDNPNLHRFNIASGNWEKLTPAGNGPGVNAVRGIGLAYDSHNDVLLAFRHDTIWVYDPDKNTWSEYRSDNSPKDNNYVFGRFRYDPVNKGVWYHGWQDNKHTTWFYRYRTRH